MPVPRPRREGEETRLLDEPRAGARGPRPQRVGDVGESRPRALDRFADRTTHAAAWRLARASTNARADRALTPLIAAPPQPLHPSDASLSARRRPCARPAAITSARGRGSSRLAPIASLHA